ncbi:MAG: hypothetical protein ABJP66_00265 [Hyphomicrobiales bacterium]
MPSGGRRPGAGGKQKLLYRQSIEIGKYCEHRCIQFMNAKTKINANRVVSKTNLRSNQAWLKDLPYNDDPIGTGRSSHELVNMVVRGKINEDALPTNIANAAEFLLDIRDVRAKKMPEVFLAKFPNGIRPKIIRAAVSIFSKRFGFFVRESAVDRAWKKYRSERKKF